MTTAGLPAGRAASLVARAVFAAALVVATWGYHQRLDDDPPYLDFDSATLGIFVNNVSFRDRYDDGFRDSLEAQNRYRARWAASFLPGAVVLGQVQRWFGIAPDGVGELLKFTGFLFGALGTLCVALVARRDGRSTSEVLFLGALVSALPAFLLYLRTAVPHFLFSYLMFWLATLCLDRYLDTGSRRWIYALAVPLVALPLVGITLALSRGAVGRVLRDPHLYAAAAASVLLFALMRFAVATTHEPSYEAWASKAERFVGARSRHAIALDYLAPAMLPDKIVKLVHQHYYHRRDGLGDRSRNDELWTLPRPHGVWLALLPLAVVGAWTSWRRRDRAAGVFAAVLFAIYGIALTVGFPEGRYLIPAVPALAFFVLEGLRVLVPAGTVRLLVLALVLVATAVNSSILVRGDYNESVSQAWQGMAGMRETLAVIRDRVDPAYGRERDLHLAWPGLRYEGWLYLEMLGNMRVKTFLADANLAEAAAGETLFAAVDVGEADTLQNLRRRGYRDLATAVDPVGGRELVVLANVP
jgi:hypothetical protein